MNRVDLVNDDDKALWNAEFSRQRQPVLWTNGKLGSGIPQVMKRVKPSFNLYMVGPSGTL